MSRPAVVWSGMAVFKDDRPVVWRGSETPKLYHSEEQADKRIARTDGCTFHEVALILITAAELAELRAERARPKVEHTPVTDAPAALAAPVPVAPIPSPPRAKRYRGKRCPVCGKMFTPKGERSIVCDECRAAA